MRFKISQTTPPFLNGRLQLRMYSFVGLVSFVVVGLALVNGTNKKQRHSDLQDAVASANVAIEGADRPLRPGEVIILASGEGDQARGQWESHRSSSEDDDNLFKPRSLERLEDDRFFARRGGRPATPLESDLETAADDDNETEESPIETAPPRSEPRRNTFDEDPIPLEDKLLPRTNKRPISEFEPAKSEQPSNDLDWDEPPSTPPLSSPKKPLPKKSDIEDLLFHKRSEPKRSELPESKNAADDLPTFDEPVRSNKPLDRLEEDLLDGVGGTVPDPSTLRDIDEPPATTPLRNRRRTEPLREAEPVRDTKPGRDLFMDDAQTPTTDQGPERDLWLDEKSNVAPFREDTAPVYVDKRHLDVVKDNTMGIRRDESEVFYYLLDHARRVSTPKLEKAALREVQYINLMSEPDRFRGEPITIEGDLWRLYEFPATRNDYGVSHVYEGWVFTGDSANHPYRVVCTHLPKGIEPGENLRVPVRITGYFFKREGYQSNGGVHVAPTLLARRINVNSMPNGIPLTSGVVPYLIGAIMAVGLALLVTIVGFAIGDERSIRGNYQRYRRHPEASFGHLNLVPTASVEESLRQFAERERLTAVSGAYGPLFNRHTAREHALHDYATSRQVEIDFEPNHDRRGTNAVQNWTARQRAGQAEIDTLKSMKTRRPHNGSGVVDELDSDSLDPARHRIAKPIGHVAPVLAPEANRSVGSLGTAAARPGHSQLHTAVSPTLAGYGVAHQPTNLADWEEELQQVSLRHEAFPGTQAVAVDLSALSAAEQIEYDRQARERETRERIARQHAEVERERLEREHLERLQREQHERERIARERAGLNSSIETMHAVRPQSHEHESTSHSHSHSHTHSHSHAHTSQGTSEAEERERIDREYRERQHQDQLRHERERLERERFEREQHQHAQSHDHAHQEYQRHEDLSNAADEEYDDEEYEDEELTNEVETEESQDTPKKKRGGGWGWPSRKKKAEENGDSNTDSQSNQKSSGWGRSRKKRHN